MEVWHQSHSQLTAYLMCCVGERELAELNSISIIRRGRGAGEIQGRTYRMWTGEWINEINIICIFTLVCIESKEC